MIIDKIIINDLRSIWGKRAVHTVAVTKENHKKVSINSQSHNTASHQEVSDNRQGL
jgi:hypothetical protein